VETVEPSCDQTTKHADVIIFLVAGCCRAIVCRRLAFKFEYNLETNNCVLC
jgi:hypothetical protein